MNKEVSNLSFEELVKDVIGEEYSTIKESVVFIKLGRPISDNEFMGFRNKISINLESLLNLKSRIYYILQRKKNTLLTKELEYNYEYKSSIKNKEERKAQMKSDNPELLDMEIEICKFNLVHDYVNSLYYILKNLI